ncbi:discoidin domain-containing protein [Paenibacillus sp. NPDC056579]|uniref:discoidin domain-containing protein n=1 Tax=Paenibacillus sp. NPDC056579 TaxID=3345871 RepID=UPI0036CD5452
MLTFKAWLNSTSSRRKSFAYQAFVVALGLMLAFLAFLPGNPVKAAGPMVMDSYAGPVTQNEINSFKAYVNDLQPVVWPNTTRMQTEYAQGKSGEAIKAMGLVYELSGDTQILDRMIYFCDVLLSQRNDLLAAPYGQRTVWTNTIAPVWPGNETGVASADSANGDPVGHLAACAKYILKTPTIWNTTVPIGDTFGYGATYKQRADKFLAEADYVANNFILSDLLDLSNGNKQYFSAASPYMTGGALPWNQQMMINYGFQNLAEAYQLVGGNSAKVAQYDGIVQTSMNWFFNDSTVKQTLTGPTGRTIYDWGYNPGLITGEDSSHGSLDAAGFYRAYLSGRYGITPAMLQPIANAFVDVMIKGPNYFAGRINGTDGSGNSGSTSYARAGFIFMSSLRPDMYYTVANANVPNFQTTGTDSFSRMLWAKNYRYVNGITDVQQPTAPSNLTALPATPTQINLSWTASTDNTGVFLYDIYRGTVRIASTSATSYSDTGLTTSTSYSYTIKARDAAGNISPVSNTAAATTQPTGPTTNLALNRTYSASSTWSLTYSADKAFDGSMGTRWSAASGSTSNQWVTIDFGATIPFDRAVIKEATFQRVTSYKLQSSNDGTTFTDIAGTAGTTIGASKTIDFAETNARYLRVLIPTASAVPTIDEIEAYRIYGNLALNKAYNSSTSWSTTYAADKAFDGSTSTRWSSAQNSFNDQWLQVDLGAGSEFSRVVIKETSFQRVTSYKLQSSNDGTTFTDIPGTAGTTIGTSKTITFPAVTSQYVRLYIGTATNEPSINEMEVYYQ